MTWKSICSLVAVLAFHAAIPAFGREGTLETRDGKRYRGFIRLEPEGVVVINIERDLLVRVTANNVFQVFLERDRQDSRISADAPTNDGSLPKPWESLDIGAARIAGTATVTGRGFHLSSAGTNILARSDAFRFVYQTVSGNSDLVARLRGVSVIGARNQKPGPGGVAGVMMRESLEADAPNVFLGTTARQLAYLQWRESKGANTRITEHTARYYPWIRLKRVANTFASYRSRDGQRWHLIEKIALPMSEDVLAGLAVASVNEEVSASALFDSVRHGRFLTFNTYLPRLELRSGSTVAGAVDSADDREVRFAGPLPKPPVSLRDVTSLRFRPVPWRGRNYLRSGPSGILLASGEFIEGDFRGVADGFVTVSSVLFGIRKFECDSEVIAVVFRKSSSLPSDCELSTQDGSTWRGTDLTLGANEVVLQEPALGIRVFPIHELRDFGWKGR